MNPRPVLLDLFCGGGGASIGYARAGFRVIGVDKVPQPDYPHPYPLTFVRADALEIVADIDWLTSNQVTVIAASPPCFLNSTLRTRLRDDHNHVDLLPQTRTALRATGLPYVIENVPGAALEDPLWLCGSMFNLGALCIDGVYRQLRRHRGFESNIELTAPGPCKHMGQAIAAHGGGPSRLERASRAESGSSYTYQGLALERAEALGIDWLPRPSLNLAVPPAYTKWIGQQLVRRLQVVG